ncbi:hypothetical protein POM88_024850 [Heracleum sosnowskyi]|uniref:NAC domain-containing protein n=1 Tax=Heracleum sosnowskyi TaxID=360622 RepID=A0AAD8MLU2_9APIA|nr:hypothetical protein POM88_024850 [Heracleum sosnowskyi]
MEEVDTTKYAKGFRFNPFDDELINDYLKPKITKNKLLCKLIKDKEVYGQAGMDLSKVRQYKMHEYSMNGVNVGLNSDGAATVVLCRITHDSLKKCTINLKFGTKNTCKVLRSTSEVVHEKEESTSEAVHEKKKTATTMLRDDLWEGLSFDELCNENFCFGDLGSSDICLDDLGSSDFCFDNRDGEDICSGDLEENSYQAKKMCLNPY